MRLVFKSILLSLLIFSCAVFACSEDWECGDPVYFDCVSKPACTILPGLGTAPGQVFWLETCDNNGNKSVYVVRANETGVERVINVPQTNELNQPSEVVRLVNANADTVYVLKNLGSYSNVVGFSSINNSYSSEFSVASTRAPNNYDIAFNEAAGISYVSSVPYYGVIFKYNTLNVSAYTPYNTLYIQLFINSLSIYNGELYWSAYVNTGSKLETLFFRGNASCDNCPPVASFASFPGISFDFEIANGRLYFATENGIESVSLTNIDFSNSLSLVSELNVNSFKIRGNRLYYNNGKEIKAINLDGTGIDTVSVPIMKNTCQCAGGFSGTNCDSCPSKQGSIQWLDDGTASCVPIDSTGFPISCSSDYHCGNIPYTVCNAKKKCECVSGPLAISPSCSSCINGASISWHRGAPICSK